MSVDFYDYIVHDDGTIISKGRWVEQKHRTIWWKEKKLKPTKHGEYYFVSIMKNGVHYSRGLHQIVWQAFNGEIPKGYEVDHIDDNPSNNCLSNLQLLTHQENLLKKHRHDAISEAKSKPIEQYTLDGKFIREWKSAVECAKELCLNRRNINLCCHGKRRSVGGFAFKFKTK